jgi:hypothetical protein
LTNQQTKIKFKRHGNKGCLDLVGIFIDDNKTDNAQATNGFAHQCITATNDVIVPKLQDSTHSSSLSKRETRHTHLRSNRETRHTRLRSQIAGFDILIFALFARFDILIFALLARLEILVFALNNHKIRYTHLRPTRKTRNTRLRSQ